MAWVAVGIAVVGAGVSIMGNNAAAASQQAGIAKQQYDMRLKQSFGEETLKTNILQSEIGFAENFGKRLDAYNGIRNVQLVSAGFQGRTVDSWSNVQQADDYAFDYDKKMLESNATIEKFSLNLNNAFSKMGFEADMQSASMAQSASASANTWANIGTVTKLGTSMYSSYASSKTPSSNSSNWSADGSTSNHTKHLTPKNEW